MTSSKSANKRLFIGGLPYKYSEGQLLRLFIGQGKVIDARIIHNQWGKSRGIGYVEFEDLNDAIEAKQKFHNYEIEPGRTIIVDFAQTDPMLTPEGQQRHAEAQAKKRPYIRRSDNYSRTPEGDSKFISTHSLNTDRPQEDQQFKPKFGPRLKFGKKGDSSKTKASFEHQRQSVFNSRNFGAKTGAKFAARTAARKKTR
ncbi:MAG: hypothetical protein WC841_01155 [Candidatus Shapirobacteria bacterium]|jgi:RNA recognition motif-containing protein